MNEEIAKQIFSVLTKKLYNRDEPFLTEGLERKLIDFIENNKPIELVGFWGVGPKKHSNWADETSCEFLSKLNREIKEIYPLGLEFTFVLATEHGIHNGYDKKVIDSYIRDIIKLFNKYSFKYIFLDDLWQKYGISFEKIDEIWKNKPKGWWQTIENREVIERNASNRNIRLDPKTAAQKYFIMRSLEKVMFEKGFPNSIFHVFSDSKLKNVLPNLPTLYFYAREGWSDVPWFVVGD